jgi:uncharacterized delta-60 repeat protein
MKKYTLSTISVSIILFFALPFVTFSQDGSLDITFDNNGIATTSIGTNSEAFAIAIQADGKIVAAGMSSIVNNQNVITLTRYNTNGSLDNTFGNAGIVTTSIGTGSYASAIAIQADGKIVVGGGGGGFTLTRYNTNGSLDNTFGNAGIVTTAIQETCFVSAIAIQADGKIVAAGVSQESFTPNVFTLTRYNTNGSLDLTFNLDGIVTTPIGTSSGGAMVGGIAIQDDGKIVIAGKTYNSSSIFSVFTLARYKTNGGLDNTFGNAGIVTTSIGTSSGGANAIAIQADGKIVAGGQAIGTPNLLQTHFALTRYNTNGSLDNTFGNAGIVTTSIGTSSHVSAIAIQADGKIVVAGTAFNFLSVFALRRYKTNGSLDNTFGSSGMVNTTYENANQANAIAIQADGKIVAAGRSYTEATPSTNGVLKFAVIRYNNSFTADISEYLNITSQISIYPNPFSNATTLKTNYLFENATLIVYNTLGEQVRKINNISGQKFTFYRENLDEGIYFYQIEENNIIVSENRFVITD